MFKIDGSGESCPIVDPDKGNLISTRIALRKRVAVGINFSTKHKEMEVWKVTQKIANNLTFLAGR
ncbi:MAG: hypothetical protein AAF705_00010 [Bacteroidota bacterium]